MTQSRRAADVDDALAGPRLPGEALRPLLESLPSAAHKQSFIVAVEAVLLGQSGICLTGESGTGRAAFVDQLAAVVPASQVVVARLGRAASPEELQSALDAAWAQCPRLAHVLLAVSDADALRRDTLDQLNTVAGDLLARRQGLQLLLAGHPRLLDRLRVIRHENLLRHLETRLVLPALAPDADAPAAAVPAAPPTAGYGAAKAATPTNLARAGAWRPAWRPGWVTGTSVVAACALLAVGGLTLAIRRTAPDRVAVVSAPKRFASMDPPRPAIIPPAMTPDVRGAAIDATGPSAPPLPSERPPALTGASPDPVPADEAVALGASTDAAHTLAPTPPAPDPAAPPVPPMLAASDPAPPPALASTPAEPTPRPPALAPAASAPDQALPALASIAATPDDAPPALASAPAAPDQAPPALASAPASPDLDRLALGSEPPARDPPPAPPPPARDATPQAASDLGVRPGPRPESSRPAGPGLLLVAERGDTLAKLYQRIYAGVSPPPFAAVLAINRGPIQPGARLLFPAPPGGWPARPRGAPQGPARAP